jgi:hypothetical protein
MPIIPIIASRKDKNPGVIGCKIKNNNIIGPNTATA